MGTYFSTIAKRKKQQSQVYTGSQKFFKRDLTALSHENKKPQLMYLFFDRAFQETYT